MADINQLITLGIGNPSDITHLTLFGLNIGAPAPVTTTGYVVSPSIGPVATLTAGVAYAMPARRVLVRVQQAGGTIECSNDGTTWAAVTLDDDEQFEGGACFIRAVTTDAIIRFTAA